MIQGTVSLDDEASDDCTMILPGMHRCMEEWLDVLEKRNLSTGALVHRITDGMFNADDETRFGTKWTPQPCRAGQVRITLPHLPHGAYGPAKNVRRTMLPRPRCRPSFAVRSTQPVWCHPVRLSCCSGVDRAWSNLGCIGMPPEI